MRTPPLPLTACLWVYIQRRFVGHHSFFAITPGIGPKTVPGIRISNHLHRDNSEEKKEIVHHSKVFLWPFLDMRRDIAQWLEERKASKKFHGCEPTSSPPHKIYLPAFDKTVKQALMYAAIRSLLREASSRSRLLSLHRELSHDLVSSENEAHTLEKMAFFALQTRPIRKTVHMNKFGHEQSSFSIEVSGSSFKDEVRLFKINNDGSSKAKKFTNWNDGAEALRNLTLRDKDMTAYVFVESLSIKHVVAMQRILPESSHVQLIPEQFFRQSSPGLSTEPLPDIVTKYVQNIRLTAALIQAARHFQIFADASSGNFCTARTKPVVAAEHRIIIHVSPDRTIFYHVQVDGSKLSIEALADTCSEKLHAIFTHSPHCIFINSMRTAPKAKKLLKSLVSDDCILWCISYAEALKEAAYGAVQADLSFSEILREYGISIKFDALQEACNITDHGISRADVMHILNVNECFERQILSIPPTSSIQKDVHDWVFSCIEEPDIKYQLALRNILKFEQTLLRGYIPCAIPLEFRNQWKWFNPSHLLRYYFGGTLTLGESGFRENTSMARSVSHVIVELAKASNALHSVGETHLRHYARKMQLPFSNRSNTTLLANVMDSSQHQHTYRIVVYDIETTGLDTENDRIVEIGLWDPLSDTTFETFVNPEIPIPAAVTQIHGITDADVASAPTWTDVAGSLVGFFKKMQNGPRCEILLLAHNSKKLDQHVLLRQFREANVEFPSFVHSIDSLPILFNCKKFLPEEQIGNLRLFHLVEQFGIDVEGTLHRAVTDAKSLWNVIEKLAIKYAKKRLISCSISDMESKGLRECTAKWECLRNLSTDEKTPESESTRRSIGHASVLQLIGNSIEENLAGKSQGNEELEPMRCDDSVLRITLPMRVDIKKAASELSSNNALYTLCRALVGMCFIASSHVPDHILMRVLQNFVQEVQKYPKDTGSTTEPSALLIEIIKLMRRDIRK